MVTRTCDWRKGSFPLVNGDNQYKTPCHVRVLEQADKTDGSLHAYLTFPGREDYGASGLAAAEPDKDAEEKILLAAAEI